MAALLIHLVLFIISLLILHAVIRSAINNSEMTQSLKNVEQLLQQRFASAPESSQFISKDFKERPSTEIRSEQCPACRCAVTSVTRTCPSCGLTLIDGE